MRGGALDVDAEVGAAGDDAPSLDDVRSIGRAAARRDPVLAGESAVYGQIECRVGDIPGCGGTVRLPRLVGKGKAIEIITTGRPFSAREMWHFGAVNQVFPDDKLREEAIKLAASIAENPSNALRGCKQSVNEQSDLPLRAALKNETRIFMQTIESKESLEAVDEAIKVYERGGDSYEAYNVEVPPKAYPS